VNPPLEASEIPKEAVSLVLILEDPDVPRNIRKDGKWHHWIIFNMPKSSLTTWGIEERKEPEGVKGLGTGGNLNYYGPCPPDREHRYYFRLFALDALLDLPEKATFQQVMKAMEGHILAETELMGRYERH